MEKVLKPYTIVPDHLYVQRDADKQVATIISDMGRPGYVLVSRQMGKTNLLLNAKSKLEKPEDAFIYVDLSNVFETPRACFENIIDTALDSHSEKFLHSAKKIIEQRNLIGDLPPHRQHINELKILIDSLNGGKLVIILDEIDALTKTDYSDQIFSQIRSMYFSARVNNKIFNNLTYLLSGVVEPTEIIKDPKVSPFNIGEKIYLNDFSKDEFLDFLDIANLKLDSDSIDRIYYWTHGHPRMSWDVCSEVENALANEKCSVELIDKLVHNLYLKSFDKAPIDNIREIVTKDKELRNSIVEISYGNGKVISDKLKSKLYLSGIINYDDKNVIIKNQIIAESLNLDWIRLIDEKEKGFVKAAVEYIDQENYHEALIAFEKYLEDNEFSKDESSMYYYYIGMAAYRTNNFQKASHYLSKSEFDKVEENKWYYNLHLLRGIVYYYRKMIDESLNELKVVIDGKKNDEVFMRALLNYGSFSLSSDNDEQKLEAREIFTAIIEEDLPEKIRDNENFVNQLKSVAYFNLGIIARQNGEEVLARENYYKAYEINNKQRPSIIIALIKLVEDSNEKLKLADELVNLIIEGKIKPSAVNPEMPLEFNYDDFKELILETFSLSAKDLYNKLVPYSTLLGKDSVAENLYNIALDLMQNNQDRDISIELLLDIYENRENIAYNLQEKTKIEIIKILAYVLDYRKYNYLFTDYETFIKNNLITDFNFFDFGIFHKILHELIEDKAYDKALELVEKIKSIKKDVNEDFHEYYLLIYHHELNILSYIDKTDKAVNTAKEILLQAKLFADKPSLDLLLNTSNRNIIKRNAEKFLFVKTNHVEIRSPKRKYGRNDRVKVLYRNGHTEFIKFKKIEFLLQKGECIIID
ncbi:AAA-like domain-containing protein [Chryseobacterium sp. 2VB]|uniref:AAA-like domain-containing protein n=1 Tax=Chryseobacterium sp. 2VB TaxID=2502204 RepID=UPI0010F6ED9F|nr:AAA-like domain-containing protein [Chryseobacterium sp. 2VB]